MCLRIFLGHLTIIGHQDIGLFDFDRLLGGLKVLRGIRANEVAVWRRRNISGVGREGVVS
jgi:hypothetical protein